MTIVHQLSQFSFIDLAALTLLIGGWMWMGWRIENPHPERPSVSVLMADFRRDWMYQMVTRDPRIFDAQLISQLRQGTAFFASTSMIAIGGGLALIGNTEQLAGVARDLIQDNAPAFVWEVKLLIILLILSNAFLKFVWAHRIFGYCSVMMASVPNDPADALSYPRATQAAELNITAARSFNRGMRATYFALTATAWLLGPIPLMIAVVITLAVLYRREFVSRSREFLLDLPAQHSDTPKREHSARSE